jgi:AcrR family transcriptional regulator
MFRTPMVRSGSKTRQPVQKFVDTGAATRREGDRELPAGPRAQKTRQALLNAAAELFAQQGYLDTTVGQIAELAGVGLGTFYQYFRDRADIITTLVRTTVVDVLKVDRRWDASRGRHGVRSVLGAFVRWYAATAPFQSVWEEVTHVQPDMAELRKQTTRMFTDALEASLADGVEAGVVRADLELGAMARALTAMVDRYCYLTYVFDPPAGGAPTPDETADLLTSLWSDALRIAE